MKPDPLPAGDAVPTNAQIAAALAQGVPDADRAEAETVLRDEVLPVSLRDVSTFERPRALVEEVYGQISQRLEAAPAEQRLHAVRGEVLRAELAEQRVRSLALGIRRYLLAHANPPAATQAWITDPVTATKDLSPEQVVIEASDRLRRLDVWKTRAESDHPDLWREERRTYLLIRHNLGAARNATFERAAGNLHQFLLAAGEHPQEIREF